MERAPVLLHEPCRKLPQDPLGVPKLANLTEEMTCLGNGQLSDSVGPIPSNPHAGIELEIHISTGGG